MKSIGRRSSRTPKCLITVRLLERRPLHRQSPALAPRMRRARFWRIQASLAWPKLSRNRGRLAPWISVRTSRCQTRGLGLECATNSKFSPASRLPPKSTRGTRSRAATSSPTADRPRTRSQARSQRPSRATESSTGDVACRLPS